MLLDHPVCPLALVVYLLDCCFIFINIYIYIVFYFLFFRTTVWMGKQKDPKFLELFWLVHTFVNFLPTKDDCWSTSHLCCPSQDRVSTSAPAASSESPSACCMQNMQEATDDSKHQADTPMVKLGKWNIRPRHDQDIARLACPRCSATSMPFGSRTDLILLELVTHTRKQTTEGKDLTRLYWVRLDLEGCVYDVKKVKLHVSHLEIDQSARSKHLLSRLRSEHVGLLDDILYGPNVPALCGLVSGFCRGSISTSQNGEFLRCRIHCNCLLASVMSSPRSLTFSDM